MARDTTNRRDPLLPVLRQLTARDRDLLGVLYDHKVLTTEQVATAFFPNLDTAQHRLVVLYRLGVIDRFRWLREGGGSYSWRYTIGHLGAGYVAALRGLDPPRRDRITNRTRRLAVSPTLDHTLGANGFFTDLLGYARTHPDARLVRWWNQDQCNEPGAFGLMALYGHVLPDGHGIWTERGRLLLFFLEYDTGTEPLGRLVEKLENYTSTPDARKPQLPVLFCLRSAAREEHLHRRLADLGFPMLIATAARDHAAQTGASPADAIWTKVGDPGPRLSFTGLGLPYEPCDLDTLISR